VTARGDRILRSGWERTYGWHARPHRLGTKLAGPLGHRPGKPVRHPRQRPRPSRPHRHDRRLRPRRRHPRTRLPGPGVGRPIWTVTGERSAGW